MDANGTFKSVSLPPASRSVQQPSIRSFFQPRAPSYTAPPIPLTTQPAAAPPGIPASHNQTATPPPPSKTTNGIFTLSQQATISPIEPQHIQPLRRINSLLLQMNYPDSFYHKILDSSTPSFSRVILWTDRSIHSTEPKVIGGLVCRLDPSLAPESTPTKPKVIEGSFDIYIQSLALLSPYREKGFAAMALTSVIDAATAESGVRIRGVYAHVWTENTEALEWYSARGFKKDGSVVNGYYWRLKPDTAWIMRRQLVPSDHLAHSFPQSVPPSNRPPVLKAVPPSPISSDAQTSRPPARLPSASFQDRRPDREWNDLPEDVLDGSLLKPQIASSRDGSTASSRSSSRSGASGRKKKERLYPAAAFGS